MSNSISSHDWAMFLNEVSYVLNQKPGWKVQVNGKSPYPTMTNPQAEDIFGLLPGPDYQGFDVEVFDQNQGISVVFHLTEGRQLVVVATPTDLLTN